MREHKRERKGKGGEGGREGGREGGGRDSKGLWNLCQREKEGSRE